MHKEIYVLHTGGTIAMVEEEGKVVLPSQGLNLPTPLLEASAAIRIHTEQFAQLPSAQLTPSIVVELAQKITKLTQSRQVDGIVITHGTDTLEETAYLLDLILDVDIPVIITGAMRSGNEIGADGPSNFWQAVRTAASAAAKDKGVLVVLHDEIHYAAHVTKAHTSRIHAFESPNFGLAGTITKQHIHFHPCQIKRHVYPVSNLQHKVMLIKMFAGIDASYLRHFKPMEIDGLVLEGFGQGNIPSTCLPIIETFLKASKPVVLVSRCYSGSVEGNYAYAGGGAQLEAAGVIFAHGLNGQKARLRLLVALGHAGEHSSDLAHIGTYFT